MANVILTNKVNPTGEISLHIAIDHRIMLGVGTYGEVFAPSEDSKVAIKKFTTLKDAMKEVAIYQVVKAIPRGIAKVISSNFYGNNFTITLERYPLSLSNFLTYCPAEVREKDTQLIPSIMYQLFTTLANMHKIGVVHGDIKPGNILLSGNFSFSHTATEGTVVIKYTSASSITTHICDFGMSTFYLPYTSFLTDVMGSKKYRHPRFDNERIYTHSASYKDDIYSMGKVFDAMFHGYFEYPNSPATGNVWQLISSLDVEKIDTIASIRNILMHKFFDNVRQSNGIETELENPYFFVSGYIPPPKLFTFSTNKWPTNKGTIEKGSIIDSRTANVCRKNLYTWLHTITIKGIHSTNEVFHLAVNICDRYLQVTKISKKELRDVGLACLYLVYIFYDVYGEYPLSSAICYFSISPRPKTTIKTLASKIFNKLQGNIFVVTASHVARIITQKNVPDDFFLAEVVNGDLANYNILSLTRNIDSSLNSL